MSAPKFAVKLYARDFSAPKLLPGLALGVEWYSFSAMGGPSQCELKLSGESAALWQALSLLRCPVEIYDESRRLCWWGYVQEARVSTGAHSFGATLDSMSNKIAVSYVDVSPQNGLTQNVITAYASDALSVADYGTKERIETWDALDASEAVLVRDRLLATYKYPAVLRESNDGASVASVLAVGWWSSLSWNYYSHAVDAESFDGASGVYRNLSILRSSASFQRLRFASRFSFQSSADTVALTEASLNVNFGVDLSGLTTSTPDDLLYCDLFSDDGTGTKPSASRLARSDGVRFGDVASVNMTYDLRIAFRFSTPYTLTPGTSYWLVIDRSSSLGSPYPDTTEVVGVGWSEGTAYTRGRIAWEWPAGTWRTDSPRGGAVSADGWVVPFQAAGIVDTVVAIRNAASAGQFVTSALLDLSSSGVRVSQYQDGSTTLLDVMSALANSGTSAGVRVLCDVTRERLLRVRQEPSSASPLYRIDINGRILTAAGALVPPHYCVCGEWAALTGVVPPSVSLPLLSSPSPLFIEESRYDARANRMTFDPRGALAPLKSIGAIR